MDNASFARKAALITGGTAGIGKATARLFCRAGANVIIVGRRPEVGRQTEKDLRAEGGAVLYVQADVSDPGQVNACVDSAVERFGRLDYALNNAASLSKFGRTADLTEEDFELEVKNNLKSIWLCMKAELQQMEKPGSMGGAIVNVSSINGLGGARGAALYSMSKAGILALTKSAAQEYASSGIRINALVAGTFDTDLLKESLRRMVGDDSSKIDSAMSSYAERIPLKRIGRAEEAAQAALWLCSDAASYVTGQSMIVDGGLTAWAR